jgi:hypothetical protein
MGMQRHGGGGQAMRVLSCIPAVTGDYLRRGGGMCYSTGPAYPLNADALCRPDLQPGGPKRSLAMTRLGQGLLDLDDPPVKALVMWAANPVASNPEERRIRSGLAREDLFTVVVEHFRTDTTDYADIVLPGAMQIEQLDLHDSYTHLYLNLNRPVVEPPGECLPHTEIFRRIAGAMGLSDPALYASDVELIEAALDTTHPALEGITYEQLERDGWARLRWPRPFLPFAERFPTPSGRFEFSSERGDRDGIGRLPGYTPPFEAAEAERRGMVALVAAANHHLLNSTFTDSPLHARGQTPVTIGPPDAERFGVRDSDRVSVENDRGAFVATVQVSSAARRGGDGERPLAQSLRRRRGERDGRRARRRHGPRRRLPRQPRAARAARAGGNAMSAPAQVFRPRLTQPLGVEELRGWQLKWYEINANPEPVGDDILQAAKEAVAATLPAADVTPAIGFAIVHRGQEAVWLLPALRRGDILYQRTYSAPLSGPLAFAPVGPDGPTACVWELVVHSHERDAFVTHILSGADVSAYLDDVVAVDIDERS